jgi:hypothetical protein
LTVTTWTPLPKGVEIDGHGGGERLSFAGLHLAILPSCSTMPAHDLHVEGPHPKVAPRGLPHDSEGLGKDIVEALASPQPLAELLGLRLQSAVGELLHLRFERRDGLDASLERLDLPALPILSIFVSRFAKTNYLLGRFSVTRQAQ